MERSNLSSKSAKLLSIICLIVFIVVSGCKKETKNEDNTSKNEDYTSNLNGEWVISGGGCYLFEMGSGEVFYTSPIVVVDRAQIVGFTGDTLKYQSTNKDTYTYIFKSANKTGNQVSTETLLYNYSDNTIEDIYYNNCRTVSGFFNLKAQPYDINESVLEHLKRIAGDRSMTGTVYDTSTVRTPSDSMYTLDTTVTFSIYDAMTLKCDKDFIDVEDSLLHYKSIDEQARTIIFQTFKRGYRINYYTTLTYNYGNNTCVLEQRTASGVYRRYLKLHG